MARYKDKLMEEYINEPFKIGDDVLVSIENFPALYSYYSTRNAKKVKLHCRINGIEGDKYTITVIRRDGMPIYDEKKLCAVVTESQLEKYLFDIGYNPFSDNTMVIGRDLRKLNMDIEGIVYYLRLPVNEYKDLRKGVKMTDDIFIPETNFNPFVYNRNGDREYYQRDYVWTIEDERNFIDSIYKGIDCGKIVIRKRTWKYVEDAVKRGETKDIGFKDIVDGKQRLHTIIRFMNDEFSDSNGMYYSDLSDRSKLEFNRCETISFLEMLEDATDKQVIDTFLLINFAGITLNKEHIEYVKNIREKII